MEPDATTETKQAWSNLKQGDTVYLIAPSARVDEATVQYTSEMLAGMGLKTAHSTNISTPYHNWGGTAAERAGQIIEALHDPKVKAIYSIEGGEGASEVVAELKKREGELLNAPNRGIPIIGYSDTTFLQHYLGELGVASPVQGPVPAYLATNDKEKYGFGARTTEQIEVAQLNTEALRSFLMDGQQSGPAMKLHPLNDAAKQTPCLEGMLVGGSDQITALSRYTTHGPDYAIHAAADKPILLLEGKSIQEMQDTLHSLTSTGEIKNYQGIVLGAYYANQNDTHPEFPVQKVTEALKQAGISDSLPVYYGAEFGHPARGAEMKPIALYTHTAITAEGENASMTVDRSAPLSELEARTGKSLAKVEPASVTPNPMPLSISIVSPEKTFSANVENLQTQDMAGKDVIINFKMDPKQLSDKDAAVNPVHSILETLAASGKLEGVKSLTIATEGSPSPEFNAWLKDYAAERFPGLTVKTHSQNESITMDNGLHTLSTIRAPAANISVPAQISHSAYVS